MKTIPSILVLLSFAIATPVMAKTVKPECYDTAERRLTEVLNANFSDPMVRPSIARHIELARDCFRGYFPETVEALDKALVFFTGAGRYEPDTREAQAFTIAAVLFLQTAQAKLRAETRCASWNLEACPNIPGVEVRPPQPRLSL